MFPSDNLALRAIENRPGLTYDAARLSTLYAEDIELLADNIVAIEKLENRRDGTVINGKIVTSVANNDLTVSLKTLAGADASATDPIIAYIGGVRHIITAALSVTKNDGTNWANLGGVIHATYANDVFIYLGYNATDGVTIGWSRICHANKYGDFSTTSTNRQYCAISTITNAASADPYCVIGRASVILSGTANYFWSIPANNIIINFPIFETRWLTYGPRLNIAATLAAFDLAYYKVKYGECLVNFAAYNRNMTGAGANFLIDIPFTNATGLFGVNYALRVGANWVGANLYCDTNAGYILVYKDYARTAWAGTENGNYIIVQSIYPIV